MKLFYVLCLILLTQYGCKSGSVFHTEESRTAVGPPVELQLEEIGSGVWVHSTYRTVPGFGRVLSNGIVVASGDDAILIDTGWSRDSDAATEGIIEEAREVSGARVGHTVFSHYHDDSVAGINALRQGNIVSYATSLTADSMAAHGWGRPDLLLDMEDGVNTWTLPFGDHHIEVFYPGPGHTVDNVVVYVPHARILYGGCLIRPGTSKSLGNMADADIKRWAESVALVRERYGDRVDIVVPSHGQPMGPELLDHTIKLVEANRSGSLGG